MDSSGAEAIHVKNVSDGVENTEKANGEMSFSGTTSLGANAEASTKQKSLTATNKKRAHYNAEDTKSANCRLQDTLSSEEVLVQSEVIDGQRIATGLSRSVYETVTPGERKRLKTTNNIEDAKNANCSLQDTFSSESVIEQSQGNDDQLIDMSIKDKQTDTSIKDKHIDTGIKDKPIDTSIASSVSIKLTTRNLEIIKDKYCVTILKKKLLILDVNGLLVNIIHPVPKDFKSDINISRRAIFKRPFLDDFLRFCFERFDVAIWSSRTRKVLDRVVDYLFGDLKKKLVFVWDLSSCISSSVRSLENQHKFIVFKKLGKIWEEYGYYNEFNTLLLDDSPYKALLNPKHSGIFPLPYSYKDVNDNSLGPDGDLRVYLEGVAGSENVKMYIEQHPFGQRPIDETSPFWSFYSSVVKDVCQSRVCY